MDGRNLKNNIWLYSGLISVALTGCGELEVDANQVQDGQKKISESAARVSATVKQAQVMSGKGKELLQSLENSRTTISDAQQFLSQAMSQNNTKVQEIAIKIAEKTSKLSPEGADSISKIIKEKKQQIPTAYKAKWDALLQKLGR